MNKTVFEIDSKYYPLFFSEKIDELKQELEQLYIEQVKLFQDQDTNNWERNSLVNKNKNIEKLIKTNKTIIEKTLAWWYTYDDMITENIKILIDEKAILEWQKESIVLKWKAIDDALFYCNDSISTIRFLLVTYKLKIMNERQSQEWLLVDKYKTIIRSFSPLQWKVLAEIAYWQKIDNWFVELSKLESLCKMQKNIITATISQINNKTPMVVCSDGKYRINTDVYQHFDSFLQIYA